MYVCFELGTCEISNNCSLTQQQCTMDCTLAYEVSMLTSYYRLGWARNQEQDSVQFSPYDRHTCHLPEENLIELTCLPET